MTFDVHEIAEDGAIRLALTGDLDLASAGLLKTRLRELAAQHRHVRLDLSGLDFMDSTGVHALIEASNHARSDGWRLEIERDLSPQVRRLFELVHLESLLLGEEAANGS